jgi:hypothetical protein
MFLACIFVVGSLDDELNDLLRAGSGSSRFATSYTMYGANWSLRLHPSREKIRAQTSTKFHANMVQEFCTESAE